jgi:hypothetical protein
METVDENRPLITAETGNREAGAPEVANSALADDCARWNDPRIFGKKGPLLRSGRKGEKKHQKNLDNSAGRTGPCFHPLSPE